MVMNRAEDAAGLHGHHAHAELPPLQALDLGLEVDRREDLHRDTIGLPVWFVAHHGLLFATSSGRRA
jgi:hypothetical protein